MPRRFIWSIAWPVTRRMWMPRTDGTESALAVTTQAAPGNLARYSPLMAVCICQLSARLELVEHPLMMRLSLNRAMGERLGQIPTRLLIVVQRDLTEMLQNAVRPAG